MSTERACANASHMSAAPVLDPVLPIYRQWLEARENWANAAKIAGNENHDHPQSIEWARKEDEAFAALIGLKPASVEGMRALAHVIWETECRTYPDDATSQLVYGIWQSAGDKSEGHAGEAC